MGFSLKDIQLLLKEGDNMLLSSLLEKRSQELATEVTELLNTRELIENYRKALAELDVIRYFLFFVNFSNKDFLFSTVLSFPKLKMSVKLVEEAGGEFP